MRKKRVSITDLARELNLSPSTVSRALRHEHRISTETRERVERLAKKMRYRPNALARSLLNQRSYTIGLVVPDFAHPFFAAVLAGAESIFTETGFQLMICTTNDQSDKQKKVLELLIGARVDGLLISFARETTDFSHFQQLQSEGTPIVFLDRATEDLDASYVITDDFQGACKAVEFLVQSGCQHIGHVKGPEQISTTFQRFLGYRETLRKHGREVIPDFVFQSEDDMGKQVSELNRLANTLKKMDGLFVFNDYIAYKVLQLCHEQGIRIPEDLSIIGYGNDPFGIYARPSITTVDQPAFEMGVTAARMLLDQIYSDPSHYQTHTQVLPTQLILRHSTISLAPDHKSE